MIQKYQYLEAISVICKIEGRRCFYLGKCDECYIAKNKEKGSDPR